MEHLKKHIIFCHGLNNTPAMMTDLKILFETKGYTVHDVHFYGHKDTLEHVKPSDWINDLLSVYSTITTLGYTPYFCGFSLGCLVHHSATHQNKLTWQDCYYFAPAIHLKLGVRLLRLFDIVPKMNFPSAAPVDYRAHRYLKVSYYKSMLVLQREFSTQPCINGTTCIMSIKDEVVSAKNTRKWFGDSRLHFIKSKKINKKDFHHIVIRKERLSNEDWQTIDIAIN